MKFHTDLGKVLEFIKCSDDKGKMEKFKEENADFIFSAEAVLFLNETTHTKLTLNEDKEEISMCKALDDMCADAREEGQMCIRDRLLGLFSDINFVGQTILMVTHSVKAASNAGRVLFIKDGEVFHQIYRGECTNEQLYQKISDTLTMLVAGGEGK